MQIFLIFDHYSMKVTVIGSGYVGLVTAACFASVGHKVTCLDSDNKKISKLKKGIIPIYEPGLSEMVKTAIANNSLSFTTSYNTATKNNIFFFTIKPLFFCYTITIFKNGPFIFFVCC